MIKPIQYALDDLGDVRLSFCHPDYIVSVRGSTTVFESNTHDVVVVLSQLDTSATAVVSCVYRDNGTVRTVRGEGLKRDMVKGLNDILKEVLPK